MQGLVEASSSTHGPGSPLLTVRLVDPGQHEVVLPHDARRNPQTGVIITKIEEILAANMDALQGNRALTIPIRSRPTGRGQLVRFPSSKIWEAKKFTALLQILHLSHAALIAGTVITKRGIYYQNPELFGTQRYVDKLVDDLAFTFGFGRDALNIVAASKGLIAGSIKVAINNGAALYCNSEDGQGVLIPDVQAITGVDIGAIKWLLVIEKEATFRALATSRFHETATLGPGVLVTAKGYPDLSTRRFLHKLHTTFPILPMYGLIDFDPHGIKIMLTYKIGSRSLQHEENATLGRLSWIGLRSDDVFGQQPLKSPSNNTNEACIFAHNPRQRVSHSDASSSPARDSSPVEAMLPLKAGDRRLAVRLLSAEMGKADQRAESVQLIRELQIMLLLNTKAEIQAIDEAGDLTAWLDSALVEQSHDMAHKL
ncbi:Spo11/DNA topoisomerase VI subunit A [Xylaria palmicola]|nr:Spo11/DNA topoisomerase VI subunit A [Xylaria palmicola]